MYLSLQQMATRFGVSRSTIVRAVSVNALPAPIRVGRLLKWPLHAVESWEREAFAEAQEQNQIENEGVKAHA